MITSSKIYTAQLVKIQPEERLAATSELPSTQVLVTGCCEAMKMRYETTTIVLVPAPEVHHVYGSSGEPDLGKTSRPVLSGGLNSNLGTIGTITSERGAL